MQTFSRVSVEKQGHWSREWKRFIDCLCCYRVVSNTSLNFKLYSRTGRLRLCGFCVRKSWQDVCGESVNRPQHTVCWCGTHHASYLHLINGVGSHERLLEIRPRNELQRKVRLSKALTIRNFTDLSNFNYSGDVESRGVENVCPTETRF